MGEVDQDGSGRRISIESDGRRTRVYLMDPMQEITGIVHAVRWEHVGAGPPTATLVLISEAVSVSVSGEQRT